jgi:predicted RNase H-like nuclease (RuvC/YqgF family)
MAHEETVETPEFRIPPFYERFQEERDRRFSSEISRLEAEIRHNGESIDELKGDIARLDRKIDSVRDELRSEIANLRREMQSQFRRMISLLLPIILGVVALLIQNLFHP